MARKRMPLDAIERKQAKAVQFLRDVADDPDKADEFESMSPEEYAEHKGIEIAESNPAYVTLQMGRRPDVTKQDMEDRITELEEENEDLQSRLDSISDIVQPVEEADDECGEEVDGEDMDDESMDGEGSDFGDRTTTLSDRGRSQSKRGCSPESAHHPARGAISSCCAHFASSFPRSLR
jgi:peptidoglycan hydrolase CwlO-like protein